MSPTERTKAYLESDGWMVGIVERWNSHAGLRQDLFGFADLLASKAGESALLVQCCADTGGDGFLKHKAKILSEPQAERWLRAGHGILLIAWAKRSIHEGVRGWPKRWEPRIESFSLSTYLALKVTHVRKDAKQSHQDGTRRMAQAELVPG